MEKISFFSQPPRGQHRGTISFGNFAEIRGLLCEAKDHLPIKVTPLFIIVFSQSSKDPGRDLTLL